MTEPTPIDLTAIGYILLGLLAFGLIVGALLLGWVLWRIRRIELPPNADFLTTLRHTPLSVVLLLDVLDLGFDFLSIPIVWVLLGHLGLNALRTVSVIEAAIPGTQFLPTMTLAWLLARVVKT